ncbi:MAG: FAD-dependent oxidoreductase, partial [Verrucomicrobiota bacterium]
MNSDSHYDVAIIGAGMSGLAAGIRLAHFGRRVCIFERHNAPGGLNSFYSLQGRKFDVGLHAITNFVSPGVKGTPLGKLLRQLRIDRDEFALCPQKQSRIAFGAQGETSLRFTNDFAIFESEIAQQFPAQIDGFRRLVATVRSYDDVSLTAPAESARAIVRCHVTEPLLEDMIFCPVMYYGSATEHDMEFGQFVIMFKALYLEGFARPFDGVRVIIRVLLEKYRAAGGERRMKCGVRSIVAREGRATALQLDDGSEITADHVISSIGAPETECLFSAQSKFQNPNSKIPIGALSFIETIAILNCQPAALGWG